MKADPACVEAQHPKPCCACRPQRKGVDVMQPVPAPPDLSGIKKTVGKRLLLGALFCGLIFFVPAGSLQYWEAWQFMAITFVPMLLAFAWLLKNDPVLLARRIQYGEKRTGEKRFITATSAYLLLLFLVPGLDYRLGWSEVPPAVVVAADAIYLLGYGLFMLTLRENSYASRIVEVVDGQALIDSGPYTVIRHPMYAAIIIMYVIAPLALGSYWALLGALPFPFMLVYRIRDEERLLARELNGYEDYRQRVRFRLVPYIW